MHITMITMAPFLVLLILFSNLFIVISAIPRQQPAIDRIALRQHRLSTILTAHGIRQASSIGKGPLPQPKGYTFDPCYQSSDCMYPRVCLTGDLQSMCKNSDHCICVGEETQLCNRCEECKSFPEESCIILPDDDPSVNGLCASVYTILEGITIEKGCNRFPNDTPIPDDFFNTTPPPPTSDGSQTKLRPSQTPIVGPLEFHSHGGDESLTANTPVLDSLDPLMSAEPSMYITAESTMSQEVIDSSMEPSVEPSVFPSQDVEKDAFGVEAIPVLAI